MAHNPFNDLYVDSLDDVMRDARRSWEMAAAICNREVRQYQARTIAAERLRTATKVSAHIESEPDSLIPETSIHADH